MKMFNLTDLNQTFVDQTISLYDVLQNYATQLDNKIMLCIMLIFTAELLYDFVLPIIKEHDYNGKYMYLKPFINPFLERAIGIIKDVAMMCAMLLWFTFQLQNGFPLIYNIWAGIIIFLVVIVIIMRYKEGKKSQSLELRAESELGKLLQEFMSPSKTLKMEKESTPTLDLKTSHLNKEEE